MDNYYINTETKNAKKTTVTKAEYKYRNQNNEKCIYTSTFISTIDIPYKRYQLK